MNDDFMEYLFEQGWAGDVLAGTRGPVECASDATLEFTSEEGSDERVL